MRRTTDGCGEQRRAGGIAMDIGRATRRANAAALMALLLGIGCSSSDGTVAGSDGGGDVQTDAGTPMTDAAPHSIGELGPGLRTLVGDSAAGYVDGNRTVSLFNNPVNVVVGPQGDIFVADFDNGLVRQVTPEGVASTLVQQPGFSRPFGMVFTPHGQFFVQTDRNSAGENLGALWRVSLETGAATVVIEDAGRVRGLASLSDGRLVLANKSTSVLSIYDPADGTLETLAGRANAPGYSNGTGDAARFNEPLDIVVSNDDEIYVADSDNHRIRVVTLAGAVSTIAGNGTAASVDGPVGSASFSEPVGLALGDDGSVYVSEFASGKLRRILDDQVQTVAGTSPGFADHEDPLQAQLHVCEGLAFDAPYLYVADGNGGTDAPYHRVRRLLLEE